MDELVAADHVAGLERVVVALDAADDAAGFAHDDLPGRHVPRLQIALPVTIETAGRDILLVSGYDADALRIVLSVPPPIGLSTTIQ